MTMNNEEPTTPRSPGTSEAVTRGIRVTVEAQYAPQRSQPQQGQWFFLYTIRITN